MIVNALIYLYRRWARIRSEFKRLWKNYLYQSFLATLTVAIVLTILNQENAVIIASIGATAFIVFAMPGYLTAKSRRVIGGHIIGLIAGLLSGLIPHSTTFSSILVYSLAVGSSAFFMVALDCEHPPASGTALGVAITGFSWSIGIAVITSSILLSLAHHFLRKYLRDLT
jgi:CBS-domain-containing membrane protein